MLETCVHTHNSVLRCVINAAVVEVFSMVPVWFAPWRRPAALLFQAKFGWTLSWDSSNFCRTCVDTPWLCQRFPGGDWHWSRPLWKKTGIWKGQGALPCVHLSTCGFSRSDLSCTILPLHLQNHNWRKLPSRLPNSSSGDGVHDVLKKNFHCNDDRIDIATLFPDPSRSLASQNAERFWRLTENSRRFRGFAIDRPPTHRNLDRMRLRPWPRPEFRGLFFAPQGMATSGCHGWNGDRHTFPS